MKIKSNLEGGYPEDKVPETHTRENYYKMAKEDKRGRRCINLHDKGDKLNRTFNFLTKKTFMKPHSHDEEGMIEEIRLIEGEIRIYYFHKNGRVKDVFDLNKAGQYIQVPSKQMHTYVVLSEIAMTYETMNGIYDKKTWKKFPEWSEKLDEENEKCSKDLKKRIKGEDAYV